MRHFNILLFIKFVIVTRCDVCIDEIHPVYNKQDAIKEHKFKQLEVKPNEENYFRVMTYNEFTKSIILGSSDRILVINTTTLETITSIKWSIPEDHADCIKTYKHSVCRNYIQLIKIFKNKILICGTNNLKPKYLILDSVNYKFIDEGKNYELCSSQDPLYLPIGEITNLGEFITGTYKRLKRRRPSFIGGAYMYENQFRRKLISTDISNPFFVKSFYIEDSVYIFLMEDAEELTNQRASTVARLCDTDNGGSFFNNIEKWTTYRKTRLICEYKNQNNRNLYFQELVDVAYDSMNQLFYAIYNFTGAPIKMSAVCTFRLTDIKSAMNGYFLAFNDVIGEWIAEDNNNFLTGCLVNPHKLRRQVNENGTGEDRTPGKQPTDLLMDDSLDIARLYQLMSTNINSQINMYQYIKESVSFTRIVVESIKINDVTITILYIVYDNGDIIMLTSLNNMTCVLKQISTGLQNPKIFYLRETENRLYISSIDQFAVIEISNCDQYKNESMCVDSDDVRCGWSTTKKKCVTWYQRSTKNTEEWKRNLKNNCPSKKSFLSAWSEWKTQQMTDRRLNCLVRERSCLSCKKTLCEGEQMIQIANCTTHCNWFWSSWSSWGKCSSYGNEQYSQNRFRECSQKWKCDGHSSETRTCAPFGISWGPWSVCSCVQMVQHRMPLSIESCEECELLNRAEYRICTPTNCSRGFQCLSRDSSLPANCSMDNSIIQTEVGLDEPIYPLKDYRKGYFLSLKDFLIISFALLLVSVIMCLMLINIALQHQRKRFLEIS